MLGATLECLKLKDNSKGRINQAKRIRILRVINLKQVKIMNTQLRQIISSKTLNISLINNKSSKLL